MKISCEYLLRYYLKFLRICGGHGETKYQKLLFMVCLSYSCIGIPQLIPALRSETWIQLLQEFSVPIQFLMTFIKLSFYFKHRNTVLQLIYAIDFIPEGLVPNRIQESIMENGSKKFVTVFKIYTRFLFVLFCFIFIAYSLKVQFVAPVEFGIEIEQRVDNPIFWILNFYIFGSQCHGALFSISINAISCGIHCGLKMRIQVLQYYVKGIGKENGFNVVLKEKQDKEMIKSVVTEYVNIENMVKMAEKGLNGVLMTHITFAVLIISTALFHMTSVRLKYIFMIKSLFYLNIYCRQAS